MGELDEKLKASAGQEDEALWRDEAKDEEYKFSGLRHGSIHDHFNPRLQMSDESTQAALLWQTSRKELSPDISMEVARDTSSPTMTTTTSMAVSNTSRSSAFLPRTLFQAATFPARSEKSTL